MFEIIFLSFFALVWIIFASIEDLRKREIANWLNFSLLIFAMGFRFFYSLFYSESFAFFYQGLIGLGIFFVLGNLFYYGRTFAGGDAKLMISLGAILPFSESFLINIQIFGLFFILFLLIGAIYGTIWSIFLMVKDFKEFKKEFLRNFKRYRKIMYLIMFFGIILMVLGVIESLFFIFGILIFLLPYFYIYARAVDDACMIKKVPTSKLTEGDWLYKDVKVGRKLIEFNWSGLTKSEINLLGKKYKTILIRQGVPFTPVFLFSFLILLFLYVFGFLDSLWNSFWYPGLFGKFFCFLRFNFFHFFLWF
ncbi:MAG: prepilin peptidase [Nanoarchaeota archaeon]|nr:prepilin peptidase [Nanoarchaeota archaeon]